MVALRNVKLKQFLFDLTMHESCGKNARMPSSRYLNAFADALNKLANNVNDEANFAKIVKGVIPHIADQKIPLMIEVRNFVF